MNTASIPYIGVGLGYRPEIKNEILSHLNRDIDWIEIISERYLGQPVEFLNPMLGRCPIIPHGVELSVGTEGDLDANYLVKLSKLANDVQAPWVSDHLAFTRTEEIEIGNLTPLEFKDDVIRKVVSKVRYIQEFINRPFLLENITYYFNIQGEMTEAEFITRIVSEADCGILLDVANLYYNSENIGYDPYRFLEIIPLDRIVQVHLAGGKKDERGKWVDTHSEPVQGPVWELFEYLAKRVSIKGVLIERDQNFPEDFSEILQDIRRAKNILER